MGFEPTWRVTANSISSRARYDHFDTSPYRACLTGAYLFYHAMAENTSVFSEIVIIFISPGMHPWTEERPSNKYPAANFSGDGRFKGLQSRAFVRLQDITLSYTFNSAKIKNFGINNLRVFFTGKNLFTITGWENGDPELGNTILSSTYPISTNLSLGANISF